MKKTPMSLKMIKIKKIIIVHKMNPLDYYNKNANANRRKLMEGTHNEKNAHNFIKCILIKTYVKEEDNVLDLGGGKGGDLSKYYHSKIKNLLIVDNSLESLKICKTRMEKIKINCTLLNKDMWREEGFGKDIFDVVSSQFAFHYAFKNEHFARKTLKNIVECLKLNGYFIGTIPVSETSFDTKIVQIPGYSDTFEEPTVSSQLFEEIVTEYGFVKVLYENFDTYYDSICKTEKLLVEKMKANLHRPLNCYNVFCLRLVEK